MKLYQLKAEGVTKLFGEGGTCYSGRIFPSRSAAIMYEPEFKLKCTHEQSNVLDLACLDEKHPIIFRVVELRLNFWDFVKALVGL